jgi:riboflavin kinase/FMN adenylyltransferase
MQHYYGLSDVALKNAWLTIGAFDGVHLGHRKIIDQITAEAHLKGAPAVVLTFYPHPSTVIHGPRESFYLTLPEEKAKLLESTGLDAVITYPFDKQVASMRAKDFIKGLKEHLGFQHLWIGHDFALGKDREGDAQLLKKIGEEMDFEVRVIDAFEMNEGIVSSSGIRDFLDEGNIEEANQLLGRPHFVIGEVIMGDQRGRTIGIPTANLDIDKIRAVPGAGVYACIAEFDGQEFKAVTNVGIRPTFEVEPVAPRIEAHLLDFHGDIYGKNVELKFLARLRDEQKFDNVEALVAQIHLDIAKAQEIFTHLEV